MPAPQTGKGEEFTAGLSSVVYRETLRPPTGTTAPGGRGSARPASGAVYPRPTR